MWRGVTQRIRKKSFERGIRGYNANEINAFLAVLAYAELTTPLGATEPVLEDSGKEEEKTIAEHNYIVYSRFEISCC